MLLEWGSCGRIVHMGGVPAGYVMYAPPSAVPRAAEMPTGPVSADAVLLTTMQVVPEFSGEGLGRMLAQAVARDLTRRGVKAIEVFGEQRPGNEPGCLVPADFLRGVGFKTIRPHPRWPRLRMELRSAITWKEDVEAALEQLLGTITIPHQSAEQVGGEVPPAPLASATRSGPAEPSWGPISAPGTGRRALRDPGRWPRSISDGPGTREPAPPRWYRLRAVRRAQMACAPPRSSSWARTSEKENVPVGWSFCPSR